MNAHVVAVPEAIWWRVAARVGLYLRLLLLLDVLFVLVYFGSNWITAQRSHVRALYFDWELRLPFVPEMIYVYFSIILLFALPLFMLDAAGLRLLARRIALATVVSGVVYLLLPARLGFERRPEAAGPHAPIFQLMYAVDGPHNLVPSLHVAYSALIVAALVAVGLPAWGDMLFAAWLGLIAVAVVLVHQHHVADVAGGFAVAWLSRAAARADHA